MKADLELREALYDRLFRAQTMLREGHHDDLAKAIAEAATLIDLFAQTLQRIVIAVADVPADWQGTVEEGLDLIQAAMGSTRSHDDAVQPEVEPVG